MVSLRKRNRWGKAAFSAESAGSYAGSRRPYRASPVTPETRRRSLGEILSAKKDFPYNMRDDESFGKTGGGASKRVEFQDGEKPPRRMASHRDANAVGNPRPQGAYERGPPCGDDQEGGYSNGVSVS